MAGNDKKGRGKARAPMSEEGRANIRAGKVGKKRPPFSDEWRAKLSLSHRAAWRDPEKRAAMTSGRWDGKRNVDLMDGGAGESGK